MLDPAPTVRFHASTLPFHLPANARDGDEFNREKASHSHANDPRQETF